MMASVIHGATESPSTLRLAQARGALGLPISPSDGPIRDTKPAIEERWGKPDHIEATGEATTWYYDREWAFSGLSLVVLIVPIPIVVPVGHRHTVLHFIGDELTYVERELDADTGCIAGLVWGHRWVWMAECHQDWETTL